MLDLLTAISTIPICLLFASYLHNMHLYFYSYLSILVKITFALRTFGRIKRFHLQKFEILQLDVKSRNSSHIVNPVCRKIMHTCIDAGFCEAEREMANERVKNTARERERKREREGERGERERESGRLREDLIFRYMLNHKRNSINVISS